ncbi:MAG: LuxR C-terminal-related transcriptional regulator [Gemmobacter sp.]
MREGEELQALSRFIGMLHEVRRERDGPELLDWAAGSLSRIVGFDAAWCGWADMMPPVVDIIGTTTLNLPDDYVAFWNDIKHDDVLAGDVKAMSESGRQWAQYDRDGARQTDGMIALSDRYGLRKLSVVTRPVNPLRPQLFISAYRGGGSASPLTGRELVFLACALDHMQAVLDQGEQADGAALRLLVDRRGRPVAGSAAALEMWMNHRREQSSDSFLQALRARGLRAVTSPTPVAGGHVLTELRLLPERSSDRLTAREREIADLIAEGQTHKQIARALGLAPATIRNQTARIYAKVGVSSRAALTRALFAD